MRIYKNVIQEFFFFFFLIHKSTYEKQHGHLVTISKLDLTINVKINKQKHKKGEMKSTFVYSITWLNQHKKFVQNFK